MSFIGVLGARAPSAARRRNPSGSARSGDHRASNARAIDARNRLRARRSKRGQSQVELQAIPRRAAGIVDRKLSRLGTALERPGLLAFVFHCLFENSSQVNQGLVAPQEGITESDLSCFIEYFLDNGYEFVSAGQIHRGLNTGGRYIHITFDDGYANNLRAVDILKTFEIAATFFVATENVELNRCFWWDVVYRERLKRGVPDRAVDAEVRWLKGQPHAAIDAYVESEFGSRAVRPVADVDRPLAPAELADLAHSPWVTIGNHTKSHAILTLLTRSEIRTQLNEAQRYLERVTGQRPDAVAYPNGNYDAVVLEVARASGFRLGITTDPRKNRLPASGSDHLALGRYVVERDVDLVQQLRIARSELQLVNFGRRLLRRRRSAQQ